MVLLRSALNFSTSGMFKPTLGVLRSVKYQPIIFRFTHSKSQQEANVKCVRRIQKTVPPYGSLKLPKCSVDVLIKPASPQDFPNMDAAIGSIYLRSDSLENSHKLLSAFDIILERDTLSIPPEPLPGHLCVLEIPIKYGNLLPYISIHLHPYKSHILSRLFIDFLVMVSDELSNKNVTLLFTTSIPDEDYDCCFITYGPPILYNILYNIFIRW